MSPTGVEISELPTSQLELKKPLGWAAKCVQQLLDYYDPDD